MSPTLDFTAALYLGLYHPPAQLTPWKSLTTGVPAALREAPEMTAIATALARLQGQQEGLLYPSTLHLFWDLFDHWAKQKVVLLADQALYPVAKWGLERAAQKGLPVHSFAHHQPKALQTLLTRMAGKQRRPVVISDGWCPHCGRAAPLPAYLKLLKAHRGYLVVDDTQALGIFGKEKGLGGGGLLPLYKIRSPYVLSGSSLAKGFGVPLAVLTGNAATIGQIRRSSTIRLHCSPPSGAILRAAGNALKINGRWGGLLRNRLFRKVALFKTGLRRAAIDTRGGLFPVQILKDWKGKKAIGLYHYLKARKIASVIVRGHDDQPRICFLFRADHLRPDIQLLVRAIRNYHNHYQSFRRYDQYAAKSGDHPTAG